MSAEESSLRVGSYVRIDGLSSSPQHNAKYGFVTSQQGDRWSVVVAHHDVLLNARPVNLTVVEPEGRTTARPVVIFGYGYGRGYGYATPSTRVCADAYSLNATTGAARVSPRLARVASSRVTSSPLAPPRV